jgi:phage virion morphogenesis protein
MAGASLIARIDDAAVRRDLQAMAGAPRRMLAPIGMALVNVRHGRFRRGSGPNHVGWKSLHPDYEPIKRGPGILRASGMLMRSITYAVGGDEVRVGSNRIYARIHQLGGVIRPKTGKYLVFAMASAIYHAKEVTIPARPYLDFDAEDQEEIRDVIELVLIRARSGGR